MSLTYQKLAAPSPSHKWMVVKQVGEGHRGVTSSDSRTEMDSLCQQLNYNHRRTHKGTIHNQPYSIKENQS